MNANGSHRPNLRVVRPDQQPNRALPTVSSCTVVDVTDVPFARQHHAVWTRLADAQLPPGAHVRLLVDTAFPSPQALSELAGFAVGASLRIEIEGSRYEHDWAQGLRDAIAHRLQHAEQL